MSEHEERDLADGGGGGGDNDNAQGAQNAFEDLQDAQNYDSHSGAYFELNAQDQEYLQRLEQQLSATEQKIDAVRDGLARDTSDQRIVSARRANDEADKVLNAGTNNVPVLSGTLDQNYVELTSKYKALQQEMHAVKSEFSTKNRQINMLIQELRRSRENEARLEERVKLLEAGIPPDETPQTHTQARVVQQKVNARNDRLASPGGIASKQPEKFGRDLVMQSQQVQLQQQQQYQSYTAPHVTGGQQYAQRQARDPYNFWDMTVDAREDGYEAENARRRSQVALDDEGLWINQQKYMSQQNTIVPTQQSQNYYQQAPSQNLSVSNQYRELQQYALKNSQVRPKPAHVRTPDVLPHHQIPWQQPPQNDWASQGNPQMQPPLPPVYQQQQQQVQSLPIRRGVRDPQPQSLSKIRLQPIQNVVPKNNQRNQQRANRKF